MTKDTKYTIRIIVGLAWILVLGFVVGCGYQDFSTSEKIWKETKSCSSFEDDKLKDIPARCLEHFMPRPSYSSVHFDDSFFRYYEDGFKGHSHKNEDGSILKPYYIIGDKIPL